MSSINILFYSNRCEGSKQLISMMQDENLLRFFHLICTDNNPKIPKQITITPTLIIRSIPTPYVAGDAFNWFSKIKQWKINMVLKKAQQNYQEDISDELLGFSNSEMNGISDIFSFFSMDVLKECQESFPQSYVPYDDIGKETIFTPPNEKNKIDKNKQKKLETELLMKRTNQDEAFKKNIEKIKN